MLGFSKVEKMGRCSLRKHYLGCNTNPTKKYSLAISLGRKQEHEWHMMLPHNLQWCCLRAILNVKAQLGHLLTALPSSQATNSCSCCFLSEPSSRSNRSSRMISLLVSVVQWSSRSRRALRKNSVCERDKPGGWGSDGSSAKFCCDISALKDWRSRSSSFKIFFFALPTSSKNVLKLRCLRSNSNYYRLLMC